MNNYTSQNYFVVINAPPQFNMPSGGNGSSDSSNSQDQKSDPQQAHQQFFAAYNNNQAPRDQQPLNVFKIFGQNVPHDGQQMQNVETNRTSSSGTGDSQEENNSTKEVVMEMCNNVILGDKD